MTPAELRIREMDDLAGGEVKRKRGRPRKSDAPSPPSSDIDDEDAEVDLSYRSVYVIRQGVPVRWLAHVFGHTEHVVKRRLRDVRPVDVGPHGNPLYTVVDAAPYLVEAKVDLGDFLRNIKDEQLPDDLRLKLWQARKARNRVLEEEGELWHSSVVIAKFSEVLLAMREKLQLIPDRIERMSGITPEQYKLMRSVVDAVQDDMHQAIMELADGDTTLSVLGDVEEVVL